MSRTTTRVAQPSCYLGNGLWPAKEALETFAEELRDVSGYSSVHIDSFLKFGDLVFDGFLMDALVQHEIGKAKAQCDEAINYVERIREELTYRLR